MKNLVKLMQVVTLSLVSFIAYAEEAEPVYFDAKLTMQPTFTYEQAVHDNPIHVTATATKNGNTCDFFISIVGLQGKNATDFLGQIKDVKCTNKNVHFNNGNIVFLSAVKFEKGNVILGKNIDIFVF